MSMVHGTDVNTYTQDDARSFVFVDTYYIRNEVALKDWTYKAGRPHAVIEDGRLNRSGNVEVYDDPLGGICVTPAGAIIEPDGFLCIGWVDKSRDAPARLALVMGTEEALLGIGAVGIERLNEAV